MHLFLSQIYAAISAIFITCLMVLKMAYSIMPETRMETQGSPRMRNIIQRLLLFPTTFFILEFLFRLLTCPNRKKFLFSLINVLDFLSILSLALAFLDEETLKYEKGFLNGLLYLVVKVFWALRCFRLIWLLRMCNFCLAFRYAIVTGWKDFLSVVMWFSFIALLFSVYISASEYDHHVRMRSIPDALWWAFMTVTTVGYGDLVPITALGKWVGVMLALAGCVFFALFTSVFVVKFTEYKLKGQYKRMWIRMQKSVDWMRKM